MFKKLYRFINDEMVKIELPLQGNFVSYGPKVISQKMRDDFELLKQKMNKPKWNIDRKTILGIAKGITQDQEKELKQNIIHKNGLPIPQGYIDFLRESNGFSITNTMNIYGHYGYDGPSIYFQRMQSFPTYISKDCLNIGSYAPDDSPIFINPEGNIFVFSGEYIFSKENSEIIGDPKKALIAYWNNIEDFITDEAIRYFKLFVEKPYSFPTKEMLPNNVTPELYNELESAGKINSRS